jgi:hypothetical protein
VQVSENVALWASAPVLRLPLVASVPLQPPEAVQDVALVEDHVSVAEPPAATVVADAMRLAVGNGVPAAELPPPPPHADSTDTAASRMIEAITRINFRIEGLGLDRMTSPHGCAKEFAVSPVCVGRTTGPAHLCRMARAERSAAFHFSGP